jgi:hypothetical protein
VNRVPLEIPQGIGLALKDEVELFAVIAAFHFISSFPPHITPYIHVLWIFLFWPYSRVLTDTLYGLFARF